MTRLLDGINSPGDLKNLSLDELRCLCSEIREFLVEKISKNGGHLASNLGVVELTVAIHKVFDAPRDKILWDVGHQSYVHKILTGRKNGFDSLRQYGGMSGFPKTEESEYDCFNTGHSSTSVSAALGMAHARDLSKEDYNIAAVFGDGAFTGGMMYEALNNGGQSKTKLILILNDNEMSIAGNVGAVSKYLRRLRTKKGYYHSKDKVGSLLDRLPFGAKTVKSTVTMVKNKVKHLVLPTNFFDELGFDYLGPIDGHNIKDLINILEIAKINPNPVLIHVKTTKGKGYEYAEKNPCKFHGIGGFDADTGELLTKKKERDYSAVFGDKLVRLAAENPKITAITGAMPDGTGLVPFMKKFPDRFFDVGIAEQHAVTMGAGLAISGYVPVIPVYSSFLQRAYDQIMHDVCLQKLHVVFCVDRAGVVGADGETHHGIYDISYMADMPYMKILSPSSFAELEQMLDYAVNGQKLPVAIRYPRGEKEFDSGDFEFGKAKIVRSGADVTVITAGRMADTAKEVCDRLEKDGFSAGMMVLSTIIPIDTAAIVNNAAPVVAVIEDHCKECGIARLISGVLSENGVNSTLLPFGYPREPIVHGEVSQLDKRYGLDPQSIYEKIKEKTECLKR